MAAVEGVSLFEEHFWVRNSPTPKYTTKPFKRSWVYFVCLVDFLSCRATFLPRRRICRGYGMGASLFARPVAYRASHTPSMPPGPRVHVSAGILGSDAENEVREAEHGRISLLHQGSVRDSLVAAVVVVLPPAAAVVCAAYLPPLSSELVVILAAVALPSSRALYHFHCLYAWIYGRDCRRARPGSCRSPACSLVKRHGKLSCDPSIPLCCVAVFWRTAPPSPSPDARYRRRMAQD